MNKQTVWVDVDRCTGCGACVEVCPVGALALVDGRAQVDEETCSGCEACVDVCPEDAIQPVVQGELVPARERPVPQTFRPGFPIQQQRPLAETAGTAVAAAGAGLLVRAVGALARAVGRWLAERPAASSRSQQAQETSAGAMPTTSRGGRGGRRRSRHRRRGG